MAVVAQAVTAVVVRAQARVEVVHLVADASVVAVRAAVVETAVVAKAEVHRAAVARAEGDEAAAVSVAARQ